MNNSEENTKSLTENFGILASSLLKIILVMLIYGAVVHTGWNDVLTRIFQLPAVSYRDAILLVLMTNIFFKSSCNCKS